MANEKSVLEMARGAIMERVDYEMAKILDNILDFSTDATKKRKLTLTLEFTPDAERTNIGIKTTAKSTLVPTNPVVTSLYIAGSGINGEVQAVEMVPQIPGQMGMDGSEADAPASLKIVKFG